MNRLLELKKSLSGFINQSDNLTLCLNLRNSEMLYIHKMLAAIDRENTADIILSFAYPFDEPQRWANAIVEDIASQIDGANTVIASTAPGERPPLSRLPAAAHEQEREPKARLEVAMVHVASLLPEGAHRVVWALLPTSLDDPVGYSQMLAKLLPRATVPPWMRPHRIIIRDDPDQPVVLETLAAASVVSVSTLSLDLSPAAFTSDIVESAARTDTPKPERMRAILQLAGLDLAYGRHDAAIDKYGVLYAYHEERGEPAMQGMCLGGVGDVLIRQGDFAAAKQRYQQGLALAVGEPNLAITLNLLLGAAACSSELRDWADAEGYYRFANEVAGKALNPHCKCDCLEQIGVAQLERGCSRDAIETWNLGLELCAQVEYWHRRATILERMVEVYEASGEVASAEACRVALTDARAREAA